MEGQGEVEAQQGLGFTLPLEAGDQDFLAGISLFLYNWQQMFKN